ncbi:hypothetical protein QTP88_017760 [Uroleucon formosanum]
MAKNNTNSQSNVNNTQTSKKAIKPNAIKLTNTADGWKTTQQNKRLLSSSSNSQPDSPTSPQTHKSKLFKTTNRYEVLAQNENENNSDDPGDNDISEHDAELLVKPPPPIYIKGVFDFQGLCTKLIELIGVDNFICKPTIDRLKIQTNHLESHRATIHLLKENKAEYHTHQLKEDKPLRVVIRNLHPSTKTKTIKEELLFRDFDIRQVTNVLHKNSKVPLLLFFIDLEPVEKSKEIFLLQNLIHTKIKVEEPYKPKAISQCTNCQDYGHKQNYYGYSPCCVRCGANHPSAACPNSREHPPKFDLCANNHPANYKGYTIYRELQQRKYSNKNNNAPVNNSKFKQSNVQVSHPSQDNSPNNHSSSTKTYAEATSNSSYSCSSDISNVISSFVDEFKALIHPLLALLTKYLPHLDQLTGQRPLRKNPDILDIFLTKIPNRIHATTENLLDLNSDHSSILLTVNTYSPIRPQPPKLFYSHTNKLLFHNLVQQEIKLNVKLKSTDDIDLAINDLTNCMQTAAWAATNPNELPKKVTKQAIKYKSSNIPIKKDNGTHASKDSEKAELFKTHLHNTFQPHENIINYDNFNTVKQFLDTPLPLSTPVKHFSPNDVNIAPIIAGVPQGGILSPILYNIYASDQSTTPHTSIAEYADDKAIISINTDPLIASRNLQNHLHLMKKWYTNWRVKVNQDKSLKQAPCPNVNLYGI